MFNWFIESLSQLHMRKAEEEWKVFHMCRSPEKHLLWLVVGHGKVHCEHHIVTDEVKEKGQRGWRTEGLARLQTL